MEISAQELIEVAKAERERCQTEIERWRLKATEREALSEALSALMDTADRVVQLSRLEMNKDCCRALDALSTSVFVARVRLDDIDERRVNRLNEEESK